MLAFKRPQNLSDILTHSKLNFSQNSAASLSSCKRRRCPHCKSINESTEFKSSSSSEVFSLKKDFDCSSENVIYLITCKRCNSQYVGQTHQKFSKRMKSHRCARWYSGCSMATIIKRNILDASPEYHFPKWNEFQCVVPNSKRVTNFVLL